MKLKKKLIIAILVLTISVAAYFGIYFLAADYVDFGDSSPQYLLRYRIGSYSLHKLAVVFEPARRVDEGLIRHRHATPFDFRLVGEVTQ